MGFHCLVSLTGGEEHGSEVDGVVAVATKDDGKTGQLYCSYGSLRARLATSIPVHKESRAILLRPL